MDITVFTSNHPRHLSLIKDLATVADNVFAIIEARTVFPSENKDFFKRSEVMQTYFSNVIDSEKRIFGTISFLPQNVRTLSVNFGDLSHIQMDIISSALQSDHYIVFGSSYIKGGLADYLVEKKAINIHMGVSPYYRGSACNFWAAYDGNLDKVGATIHLLSKGLDSGEMLFHSLPSPTEKAFDLGMQAVKSAHKGLIKYLSTGELFKTEPVKQEKRKQIRYCKISDFNDEVALDYLKNIPDDEAIKNAIKNRDLFEFLNPFIY